MRVRIAAILLSVLLLGACSSVKPTDGWNDTYASMPRNDRRHLCVEALGRPDATARILMGPDTFLTQEEAAEVTGYLQGLCIGEFG